MEESLPEIAQHPENPTVEEAMLAWMGMAKNYATLVVRQHAVERETVAALKDLYAKFHSLQSG